MARIKYVAISIGGTYLRAGLSLLGQGVNFAGHGPGNATIWERIELGGGHTALRTLDGLYLAYAAGGGWTAWAGDEIRESQMLQEVWWPDDSVSVRSAQGVFLCAENGGGGAVGARTEAGPWERFWFEKPPDDLLPGSGNAEDAQPVPPEGSDPAPVEPRLGETAHAVIAEPIGHRASPVLGARDGAVPLIKPRFPHT